MRKVIESGAIRTMTAISALPSLVVIIIGGIIRIGCPSCSHRIVLSGLVPGLIAEDAIANLIVQYAAVHSRKAWDHGLREAHSKDQMIAVSVSLLLEEWQRERNPQSLPHGFARGWSCDLTSQVRDKARAFETLAKNDVPSIFRDGAILHGLWLVAESGRKQRRWARI